MATIYCKSTGRDIHSFYVRIGKEEYYLFSQSFRKGVHQYYSNGVDLNSAMDCSRGKHDTAILRTMNKLPRYIKYVEKEYRTIILEKTGRNKDRVGYSWA